MTLKISSEDIKDVEELKSSADEFAEWLGKCPVDYEFSSSTEDDQETVEWYFFRIPKDLE